MPNWKKLIVSGSSANLSNLTVDNAVTASYFKGDGSALTGVTTEIVETATVSDTFTSVTSKVVEHNFGTKDVITTVYNSSDEQILPSSIVTTTVNSVTVTFDVATSGRIVVAKGGHIVQGVGTAEDSNTLNGQSGSYYLDYTNFTNVPSNIISSSAQIAGDISGSIEGPLNVLRAFTGSYATTGSNTFVGDQSVTGSFNITGSTFSISGLTFPAFGEKHFFQTEPFELAGRTYEGIAIGLENTGSFGLVYEKSFLIHAWDDHENPTFGTEINLSGLRAHLLVQASGSLSLANVSVQDLQNGNTQTLIYGDEIQFGVFNGDLITIGNSSTNLNITASQFTINSDITASGHLIPFQTEQYDLGSAGNRWRDLYLSGSTIYLGGTAITTDADGNVELKEAGTSTRKTLKVDELEIQSGSKSVRLKLDDTGNVRFEDVDTGDTLSLTFFKTSISGNTTYSITHSLAEDYPIVQVYDTDKNQVLPASITSSNENVVQVVFDSNFNGTVVVKK